MSRNYIKIFYASLANFSSQPQMDVLSYRQTTEHLLGA